MGARRSKGYGFKQYRSANQRRAKRVWRALQQSLQSEARIRNPILEQLTQCPEAFKVGEILGKTFDRLKYDRDGAENRDCLFPPVGTIVPPFA
jgi:hypothetical protein